MQEKSDLDVLLSVANSLTKQPRQNHQMIILNPDKVAIFYDIGDFISEFLVCLEVCFPSQFVEVDFSGMVVEEWPAVRSLSQEAVKNPLRGRGYQEHGLEEDTRGWNWRIRCSVSRRPLRRGKSVMRYIPLSTSPSYSPDPIPEWACLDQSLQH